MWQHFYVFSLKVCYFTSQCIHFLPFWGAYRHNKDNMACSLRERKIIVSLCIQSSAAWEMWKSALGTFSLFPALYLQLFLFSRGPSFVFLSSLHDIQCAAQGWTSDPCSSIIEKKLKEKKCDPSAKLRSGEVIQGHLQCIGNAHDGDVLTST